MLRECQPVQQGVQPFLRPAAHARSQSTSSVGRQNSTRLMNHHARMVGYSSLTFSHQLMSPRKDRQRQPAGNTGFIEQSS